MKRASLLIVLALSIPLAACAIERAEDAHTAQAQLVGASKARVLQCMGAPDSAAQISDGMEVMTYHTGDGRTDSFGAVSRYGFYGATSETRSCKVDVIIDRDHVSRVNYSGLTGGIISRDEQCAYAVENCLQR